MKAYELKDDGVHELVQRIVQVAMYDYRNQANTVLKRNIAKGITDPDELLTSVVTSTYSAFRWFRSQWFYALTGADSEAVERAYIGYIKTQINKRLAS